MKKLFLVFIYLFTITLAFPQVITLKKKYFTIYFHEKQKAPLYTVYTLKPSYLVSKPRHGSFKPDPGEDESKQASDATYDDPAYDKGHLSPDADFRFDDDAEAETFLYTNAAPQLDYFNEHLWANVEKHTRDVCKEFGNVKVYTGCLYSSKKLNGVGIPAYYWKVIVYKDKNHHKVKEAYLGKNKKPASNNYASIADDVADVEKRTGLKF
ncbi:MAG: non-specific endonuclease [Chitinophagaceae bacterium]|nr:non-specific endonuclease [Chitinophagaceae bacterium]